ncbi:hypothetical protein [Paenibacillus sp. FSL R10-2736]|uniref:hypothetical protein n=1 Tax=Paenibacillus sp. FSL R10-2736 TaxID=2954692 RepID=UPI0030FB7D3C
MLWKMDIPIKEIKSVIIANSVAGLSKVIVNKLNSIRKQREEIGVVERQLNRVLEYLERQNEGKLDLDNILTEINYRKVRSTVRIAEGSASKSISVTIIRRAAATCMILTFWSR